MPAGEGMWLPKSRGDVAQPWLVAKGLVASILFALGLAAFLLVRRATGALEAPLPPLLLVLTATALFAWVSSVRIACQWRTDRGAIVVSPFEQTVATWLPLVTLTMVAVACSYPGRRVVDWLVWVPVILANSIGPEVMLRFRRPGKNPARRSSPAVSLDDVAPLADESGTLLQQLSRSRDAEGRESVHGTLVAEFARANGPLLFTSRSARRSNCCRRSRWKSPKVPMPASNWHKCSTTAPGLKCGWHSRQLIRQRSGWNSLPETALNNWRTASRRSVPALSPLCPSGIIRAASRTWYSADLRLRRRVYEQHANRYWCGYTLPGGRRAAAIGRNRRAP